MPTSTTLPNPKKRAVHFDSSITDQPSSPPKKLSKSNHSSSSSRSTTTAFISSLTKPHPLGVRPSGNTLLCSDPSKCNPLNTLGPLFGKLPEPLLMTILQEIEEPMDLLHLGHTCKAMFAYAWNDELWKHMVYRYKRNPERWNGSWRRTMLDMSQREKNILKAQKEEEEEEEVNGERKIPDNEEAVIDCKDIVFSDLLYRPFQCSQIDYKKILSRSLQDDIKQEEESQSQSHHKSETKLIPIMNESFMTLQEYNANWHSKPFMLNLESKVAGWTVAELVERFGETIFRQEFMDWKLGVYNEYMNNNCDESPLYLFDCRSEAMRPKRKSKVYNGDSKENKENTNADNTNNAESQPKTEYVGGELSKEYRLPASTFTGDSNDVFTVLKNVRPDHRWLILGPARSGSSFHKDPNATTAWNVVLTGHKYWIMFPPSGSNNSSKGSNGHNDGGFSTPPGVATDEDESEVTAPVSIAEWFASGYYDQARQTPGFCHGICGPGQMMHVPSGWWHLVVNLDECLALTGNYVPVVKVHDVMDFLHNKHAQISGFKWKAVEKELVKNYKREGKKEENENGDDDGDNEEEEEDDDDDDCATGACPSADISQYVFYLFVSKILQSGNPKFIATLTETFARMPLLMLYREKERIKREEIEKRQEACMVSSLLGPGDGSGDVESNDNEHRLSRKWQQLVGKPEKPEPKNANGGSLNTNGDSTEPSGDNQTSGFSFGFSIGGDDLDDDIDTEIY